MEARLKEDEINNLISMHKTIKIKTEADKIKCIIYWGKGWSWQEIKEALFISDHFILDVTSKYKQKGIEEVLKNNFTGHNYKMTKEQESEFVSYLKDNYIPNSKFACKFLKDKFNLDYTQDGMVITLKRLGFRYKKPVIIPGKTPDVKVQEEFIAETKKVLDSLKQNEAVFFWDGAGMVHNVKLDYGWIKKGESQVIRTNTGREKMNINGAYNPLNNEFIGIEQHGKISVNQDSNIQLIEKIISKHPEYKKIYIYLDNSKSNRSNKFKEYLKNMKNIEVNLIFLPSYSPNLNLIERLWKYSKKLLLIKYYETFEEFKNRIIDFFENEIKSDFHREELKRFIGTSFHIIKTG